MFKQNYYLIEILILCWIIYLCESKFQDTKETMHTSTEKFRRIVYPTYVPMLSPTKTRIIGSSISSSSGRSYGSNNGSSNSSSNGSNSSTIGSATSSISSGRGFSSSISSNGSANSSTNGSNAYNQKIMKNQNNNTGNNNTGNNTVDLCSQDRNRKLLCYCLPNELTKNGHVIKADCWIYQKNLYQNDSIWLAFNHKKSLKHIKFTVQPTGHLDYIPTEYIKQLHNLTTIIIEYAQISILHGYAFGSLPKLEFIQLQNNGIQILDQDSFVNHAKLHELHLENNNIYEIDRYSFRSMPKLNKLYMQSNNLSHITEEVFSALGSLEELDIGYNFIGLVTANMFKGLGNLRYLKFTRNNLIVISDTVFAELWSLQELELDDNNIERLSRRAFDGLNQLKVLNLRGNRLKSLDNGLLRGTPALLSLNLQENYLESLTGSSFEPIIDNLIYRASELLLSVNNFVCDCRLLWVFDLKNRTKNEKMKASLDEIECTMLDTKYQQFQTSSSSSSTNLLYMNSMGSSKSIQPELNKNYYDNFNINNNNDNNNNNDGDSNYEHDTDNVMELTKLDPDLLPCPPELKEPTELPLSRESIRISDNREPEQFLETITYNNCQSKLLYNIYNIIIINLIYYNLVN